MRNALRPLALPTHAATHTFFLATANNFLASTTGKLVVRNSRAIECDELTQLRHRLSVEEKKSDLKKVNSFSGRPGVEGGGVWAKESSVLSRKWIGTSNPRPAVSLGNAEVKNKCISMMVEAEKFVLRMKNALSST
ncbi:hypothetical protein ZHAS_00004275 [Anopheles sinensis]|uniref:Uncharacterized protein n=1 Tax=Anopheles sinensis TaxID=74873 RepID=A0A084VGH3_ANOSI|nr:hypothetical protein ZHAS_00004275 [Anopheles sinensis]